MNNLDPYNRDINGILLVDKPSGLSSNNVLQKIKKLFYANKAGHAGSLDPIATGMLPICFGEATKFAQYLLYANKSYQVTAQLGKRTDTFDSEGKVISIKPVSLNKDQIHKALKHLCGTIYQMPPIFSALKYQGQPMYKYARKGIAVPRTARYIKIYSMKLIKWDLTNIELKISCSKGTYIRALIDDLGKLLYCGAHVTALRRLSVSNYSPSCMIKLRFLQSIFNNKLSILDKLAKLDSLILPIDHALTDIPKVKLQPDTVARIRLGQTVNITKKIKNGIVRLIENNTGCFFGIGEINKSGVITPKRLIVKSSI